MAEQTDVMTSFQLPEDFQLLPPPEPRPDTDVTVTDALKAFGVGAADLAAGVGEVAEQTLGLGGSLRELAHSGSQALRRSMTDDGQTALRTPLFTETDGGNLTWGEGAGDLDVWAMKIANGLGSMAGMLIPGGAVGQAARITLGQAITRSMLKRGASLNVAQQVAEKVVRHMASATAIGTGLTGSLGATAIDVATQVKDMDTAWLAAHSPYFRHQVNALARQAQVKNATQILKQAKEATAQRVSAAVLSDPVAIAGSTVGALGDRVLFGALTNRLRGGILKSGVRSGLAEGSAESAENLGHTYAANTQLNTIVGTDRAPLEGAKAAMAEGFSVGAITGSVPGMIGGWRGKGVVAQPEAKPSSNAPEPELETDSLPPRPTPTQHESPSPPHNPQPQAAALPVTPRSPSPIPPTEPNDVEPSPHSSSSVRAPDAAALSPQEKIVDFGDVLHGARKHLWGQYGQAMEHHPSDEEWRRKPLSQLFPKPNLSALIKQKVPPERALLLSVLRERLPPKPKLASKVASWRVSVEKTLALSRQLVQPLADESLPDAVSRAIAHTDLPILMKAAQGLTPEQLTRLAKLKVNRGQYTQLNGARFTPARTFYHATEGNKRQALTERVSTEAEMVTALQQWVRDPNDAAESGRRKVNLKVYRTRDPHPERFIGVDVGKRHVRLIGGFASAQAAREHLNTHRDTLEKEVLALRKS
ncbi:LPD5 domain-containing protein [Vibrio penaeicida]|uniref:LPD5 domain-containing protein n=1 Tax=Vibrio penaeicida TaxID=104609 RepID=UPI001CC69D12|nr:LPD5 domain-containing protein [Vibrio penaeicida]